MISYYFGNKAGLVAAVLDSVIHDEYIASQDRMKDVAPGERIPRLVEEMQRMAASVEDFDVFFELLPHVLRDEVLRRRMAMLFRWYWKMKLEWLGVADGTRGLADPDLLGVAQLLSAIIDGLAIQAAVDPGVDLSNPTGCSRDDARVFRRGGSSRGSTRRAAAGPRGPGRPAARQTAAAP